MTRSRDMANLGSQAGSGLDASDITTGVLPVGVTGGSGLTALGTVASGTLGLAVAGNSVGWSVTGAARGGSTAWPPLHLPQDAVTGVHFVQGCTQTVGAVDFITLTYGGTYLLDLACVCDVGVVGGTNAAEIHSWLYVQNASVNSGTYNGTISSQRGMGGASGTRSDNNGQLRVNCTIQANYSAGDHLWVGCYQSPTGTSTALRDFTGVLIR